MPPRSRPKKYPYKWVSPLASLANLGLCWMLYYFRDYPEELQEAMPLLLNYATMALLTFAFRLMPLQPLRYFKGFALSPQALWWEQLKYYFLNPYFIIFWASLALLLAVEAWLLYQSFWWLLCFVGLFLEVSLLFFSVVFWLKARFPFEKAKSLVLAVCNYNISYFFIFIIVFQYSEAQYDLGVFNPLGALFFIAFLQSPPQWVLLFFSALLVGLFTVFGIYQSRTTQYDY